MKKRLLLILAVVLTFTGVFGGLFAWQYLKRRAAFPADGYVIASEEYQDTVVCDYFSLGTTYRKTYDDRIVFTSAMGTREQVVKKSFLHYGDASLSSLKASMLADLDEVENGLLDFYYLAPEMVLSHRESGYAIDNNGTDLEFSNFLSLLDEDKFLVQSGGLMTLKLASGSSQELDTGYLEVVYPEENIVRLYNQESMWQSIATGCQIVLANGVVIDLGERTVYDSKGTARFTIDDVAMDLASGGGIAVQSDSATEWVPPTFEFEVVDGADGVSGEDGAIGVDGENGRDGVSGEEGMDNEDGEDGEEGEQGEDGEEGEEGDSGDTGASGAQGANGTNGNDGASGASGASGAGGGTAGGGSGAGSEIGSALGQVIITQLEYDCSEATFSFYAENESGAMQGGCYVEIIETATNRVVRRIDDGEDADDGTSLNPEINTTDINNQITLTVQGLSPDTEYQILIYCKYSVTTEGTQHDGTKVYASRKFYTSSEGVSMSLQSVNQTEVGIHLDKKNFSQVQSARVYVSFEGADDQGKPIVYSVASEVFDLNSGKKDVLFTVMEDEDVSAVGLTSNIPYSVVLYTSNLTANASGVWEEDADGRPVGLKNGDVVKSGQQLSGRTLKAVPEFGKITCYQNSHGSYQVYLDTVNDPDNSVESYVYKIYEYTENTGSDPTKTLVKTLSTINSTGVELFVDEQTIQFNKTYIIECEATYFDNVKNYTALISGSLTTGTGEAIVTFIPAEVNSIKNDELREKYTDYGVVGPTWMYGYLEINTKLAGFDIDKSEEIMVQVSCGDDYTRTLHYDQCVEDNTLNFFYDESVTPTEKCIYNANLGKLFLPVNLWGLKADSYYTFSVNANIHYSDTTSATKNVGSAIYKTEKYNEQNKDKLPFVLENITTGEGVPDGKYPEMTFAVTMQKPAEWEDGYPIEVLSARAIEISTFDDKGVKNSSHIIDLYEYYGLTSQASKPEDLWCNPEISPLARYLEGDTDYMKDAEKKALVLFDTTIFGSTAGFTSITADVTAVYDYTYKKIAFYPEMESSNMGYQNELMFTSSSATYTQGKKPPVLPANWEAVEAVPIKNRSAFEAGSQTITNVLGNRTVDEALDPTVTRGYRLEAEYQSSEMEVVTYYLFTYDDWAYFNKCLNDKSNGADEYFDIISAAEAAEDAAAGAPVSYWKDRVLKIEIDCKDKGFTNAPALHVIYDESEKEKDRTEEQRKNAVTVETGGYCYKTDFLKRGQTYISAFKVLDGYRRNEDTQAAEYVYPDMDPRYGGGNSDLLRSVPFQMDRQEPRVKLLWNHTEPDGSQEWKFFIYDPDEALGKITLREEGVASTNTLTTWKKILDEKKDASSVSWKDGYVMVSHYTSMGGTSPLVTYVGSGYTIADMNDNNRFPEVKMSGNPTKIDAKMITTIFDDSSTYRQSTGNGFIDMGAEGRSWQGTFTIEQPSAINKLNYIFLGRSLNDSVYLTDKKTEDKSGGLQWNSGEKPTLYMMAAAQFYQPKLYSDGDVSEKLRFIASTDNNSLYFKVASTDMDLKNHIVALEITIWQSEGSEIKGKYQELEKKTVAFNGETAEVPLGTLKGYAENRYAYANVRAIYDTGMYGTAQVTYGKAGFKIDGTPTLTGGDQIVLGSGTDEKTITLWKQAEQKTGSTPFSPHSLRRQEELYWYSGADNNRPTTGGDSIAGSTWMLGDNTAAESENALAKAVIRKWAAGTRTLGGTNTLGLKGKPAVGTGYLDEDSKFTGTAVSGWNDKEVKKNLVFGNLGIADSSFVKETGMTSNVTIIEEAVTLEDKDGNELANLQKGQAVYFFTPRTNISTSSSHGYTKATRTYNKVKIEFELDESSMPKLLGVEDTVTPPLYLPYVFVEVYEDTKERSGSANPSGELGGYYIQDGGAGNLVDDLDYTTRPYLKGPKSFYNDLWGQAAGGSYKTGKIENGKMEEAKLGAAFANVAAIPISEWIHSYNRGSFTISNLQSRGNGYPRYSVRLYVLPLIDKDKNFIDYSAMTNPAELKDTIADVKEYVLDNAKTTNSTYDTSLCYYTTQKHVWWKLTTNQPAGIAKNGATEDKLSATYSASGYNDKNVTIKVTNNGFVKKDDTCIEFQILDQDNKVILSNDEIMARIGSGYVPVIRPYTYYMPDGTTEQRQYLTYMPKGSTTQELSSEGSSFTVKVADLINSGKLKPGNTYKLQARLSHKDPTLAKLQAEYTSQGAVQLYQEKDGLWSNWEHLKDSYPDVYAKNNDPEVNTLILMQDNANVQSWQECKLKIPAGTTPYLGMTNADYTAPAGAGEGLDMKISLSVQDKDYVLGTRDAAGTCTPGKFYVKVYRGNGTEASQAFGFQNTDGSYVLQDITKTPSGTYSNNKEYLTSYYVEVWGTTNGLEHTTDAPCKVCTKTHAADEVDAYGNIRLGTSKDDTMVTSWLTMPDASGIRFTDVEFTYNNVDGTLKMQVIKGVGYENLVGEAIITVTPPGENVPTCTTVVPAPISWKEKTLTAKFSNADKNRIKGSCMITIVFHTSTGDSYQYTNKATFAQ